MTAPSNVPSPAEGVPAGPVLVTGGTGFVGSAVTRRLLDQGRDVAVLVRSTDAAARVAALGATPVEGDVLDADSLRAAMRGRDSVFHLAGLNAFCLPDPRPMYHVNVEGSRLVVRAAAQSGVRRVVHTSSAATLGERRGEVGHEGSEHRGSFLSHYERSKHDAEVAVLATAARLGVDVVCVNPSSVQGPGRVSGTARIFLDALNGRLRLAVDTRLSVVDVDDCAAGHLLAEQRGRSGARYVLSGATLPLSDALALLGDVTGLEITPRLLPPAAAIAAAAGIGTVARLRGRRAPLCPEMARTLLHGHAYDGSRATRDLGLRYTPLRDTVERTVRWYVKQGLVSRPLPQIS